MAPKGAMWPTLRNTDLEYSGGVRVAAGKTMWKGRRAGSYRGAGVLEQVAEEGYIGTGYGSHKLKNRDFVGTLYGAEQRY